MNFKTIKWGVAFQHGSHFKDATGFSGTLSLRAGSFWKCYTKYRTELESLWASAIHDSRTESQLATVLKLNGLMSSIPLSGWSDVCHHTQGSRTDRIWRWITIWGLLPYVHSIRRKACWVDTLCSQWCHYYLIHYLWGVFSGLACGFFIRSYSRRSSSSLLETLIL